MTYFPHALDEAASWAARGVEPRAGGTDVQDRRRIGRTAPELVDLTRIPGLDTLEHQPDGSVRAGAMVRVARLASDPVLGASHPGLARAAGGLATPQIRTVGTLGGNLLQRTRCSYYREPHFTCWRTGGEGCPSRAGDHLYAVCIDQGPCIAPHPSTLAVALLAYEARVVLHGGARRDVTALYGDGSDGARDHLLAPGELLVAVELPATQPGERATYRRTIARALAEWPLVEVAARVRVHGDTVALARVAVGGVANTPLRLREVEHVLEGARATPEVLQRAVSAAVSRCAPLPQTGYKVALLAQTVRDALSEVVDTAETPREA